MSDAIKVMARAIYDAAEESGEYVGDYQFHHYGDDVPPVTCLDGYFDLDAIARAALTALQEAGWAVVPKEPTEAMVKAGGSALKTYIDDLPSQERAKLRKMKTREGAMLGYRIPPRLKCRLRWSAMLKAARG